MDADGGNARRLTDTPALLAGTAGSTAQRFTRPALLAEPAGDL